MSNGNIFNGERAKRMRRERGLSILDVCSALHVSPSSYSRYETGKREPSYAVCVLLADLFGCSMEYLMGTDDEPGRGRVILSYEKAQEIKRALQDISEEAKRLLDQI